MYFLMQLTGLKMSLTWSGETRGVGAQGQGKFFLLFSFNLLICIFKIFLTMKIILDGLFLVVNQKFLTIPVIPRGICILRSYYLKTYHLPLILHPTLGNLPIYTAEYIQMHTSNQWRC